MRRAVSLRRRLALNRVPLKDAGSRFSSGGPHGKVQVKIYFLDGLTLGSRHFFFLNLACPFPPVMLLALLVPRLFFLPRIQGLADGAVPSFQDFGRSERLGWPV